MTKIRLGINKSSINRSGKVPVQIVISADSKTTTIGLDVYVSPANWDDKYQIVLPSETRFKNKNGMIESAYNDVLERYENLYKRGKLPGNVYRLRELLIRDNSDVSFTDYMNVVIDEMSGNSKVSYKNTLSLINSFSKKTLYFDDITPDWLQKLERFYTSRSKYNSINGLAVNLRNIRKVYNKAIDENKVSLEKYPFRKFKIKTVETRHRTMTVRELNKLRNYNGSSNENWARDVFMISFYLIGMNMKDLFEIAELDKRATYHRSKTNKLYNIKIEPEAKKIIDRLGDYRGAIKTDVAFKKKVNKYLKSISENIGIGELTTYYARHTWGTFAGELDIPKETISKALGHGSRNVTDIYIDFNQKKVDKANRLVIDYSLKVKRNVNTSVLKEKYHRFTSKVFSDKQKIN